MGCTSYSKAFLLDEKEIEEAAGHACEDFDTLSAAVVDFVDDEIGNWDHPWVEHIGVCSERFDTSVVTNGDIRSAWLTEGRGWSKTLSGLISYLANLDEATIAGFLETGSRSQLIENVARQVTGAMAMENFDAARRHLCALENLKSAGLPCFRPASRLTGGADDDAHDLRQRDHGAGRRAIVEIAFVWD